MAVSGKSPAMRTSGKPVLRERKSSSPVQPAGTLVAALNWIAVPGWMRMLPPVILAVSLSVMSWPAREPKKVLPRLAT